MEVLSPSQESLRCCGTVESGKELCKCAEGWSCSVTKTDSSKAGKPFCQCFGDTTCLPLDESESSESEIQKALDGLLGGCKVICNAEAGYTCKITKAEGPKAGEVIAECGEGCICIVDENGSLKCKLSKPAAETSSCCSSGKC